MSRVYLRGVNLEKVVEGYRAGSYQDAERQAVDVGDHASVVKTAKAPPGATMVCNSQSMLSLGKKTYDDDQAYNCMHCLRPVGDDCVGIPIYRERAPEDDVYHMVDIFCGLRCAYAAVKRRTDSIYSQSAALLMYLWRLSGDTGTLTPSPDPRLLKVFNGPLSWDEYHALDGEHPTVPGGVRFAAGEELLQRV